MCTGHNKSGERRVFKAARPIGQESPQNEKTELRLEGIKGNYRLSTRHQESQETQSVKMQWAAVRSRERIPCIDKERKNSWKCQLPESVLHTRKEWHGNETCCWLPCELWDTSLLTSHYQTAAKWCYGLQLWSEGGRTESLTSHQRLGGDEKRNSLPGEVGRWVRDNLIGAPHKLPILSHPGRITRHSSKLQANCGSTFASITYVDVCKAARAPWQSHSPPWLRETKKRGHLRK